MFLDDLTLALATARSEAHRLHHDHVRPEHLTLGILRTASPTVRRILGANDPARLASEFEAALPPDKRTPEDRFDLPYTHAAKVVIERAMLEAHSLGTENVASEHLLVGVLRGKDAVACAPFAALGLDAARVLEALVGPRDRGEA